MLLEQEPMLGTRHDNLCISRPISRRNRPYGTPVTIRPPCVHLQICSHKDSLYRFSNLGIRLCDGSPTSQDSISQQDPKHVWMNREMHWQRGEFYRHAIETIELMK